MEAEKNRPLYGCTNCYEDYSWPAVDLAMYEGECWCENCWDERRWEGDLPYFSDLDDFIPEQQRQLEAERERVRVLREAATTAVEYLEHVQLHTEDSHALHFVNMAGDWIKTGLATTAPEAGQDGETARKALQATAQGDK